MIVHTLKMCTCDTGPEQSLALFQMEFRHVVAAPLWISPQMNQRI